MKNSDPLVSVLLVVRNVENDIKRCLLSIFKQTYNNIEIILIDDFSTDGTIEICEFLINNYCGNYCIKYFKNSEQKGLTKSLNFGISRCKGKYIARQDGDDWSHKERISRQVSHMENSNIDLLGTSYYMIDRFNLIKIPIILALETFCFESFLSDRRYGFPHGSFMIKSSVLKINYYNESCLFCQDFELLVWFSLNNYEVKCIEEPLYYHKKPTDYNLVKKELKSRIHSDIIEHYKINKSRLLFKNDDNLNLSHYSNNFNFFNYYMQFLKTATFSIVSRCIKK